MSSFPSLNNIIRGVKIDFETILFPLSSGKGQEGKGLHRPNSGGDGESNTDLPERSGKEKRGCADRK